jgi:hypothetical protein
MAPEAPSGLNFIMKRTTFNIILLGGVVILLAVGYYIFTRAVEEEVERPEITIVSPADGSVVSQESGVVSVDIRFSPPKTPRKVRTLKVALNDIDISSDILVGGGFARGWVPARLGQNVLTAEVDGEKGSGAVSRFKVTVRPKAPKELASGGEGEKGIITGEKEPAEGEAGEEAEEEVEPLPEIVFHPGEDEETPPPAFGGVKFPEAGKKPVEPEEEEPGEKPEVDEVAEPPVCPLFVTITYPADGSEVDELEITVRGETCPEQAVRLYVALHRLGGEEVLIARANRNGGYRFPRVSFRAGDNSIRVVVNDEAGNIALAESNFRVRVEEEEEPPPCTYDIWIDCPGNEYPVGDEFTCGINVCLPERNLMVYDMRISHDPSVVNLLSASGGDAGEFSSLVINIKNTATDSGLATSLFNGVNNGSTMFNSPSGLRINVAKLTFKAVGEGRSGLVLQSVGLWDTNLKLVTPGSSGNEWVKVR